MQAFCRPLALLLLVFWVGADDHDIALALDDLAFFANWLYAWPDFHLTFPPNSEFSILNF